MGRVATGGFRGEVDQAGVFDVVLDVAGAGGVVQGVGGARVGAAGGVARGGLPVRQPQRQRAALGTRHTVDEHALRPERAVDEALAVGVLQRLGEVAHELQPLRQRQARAVVAHQVVEPHRVRVVLEQQRRAEFGVLVVLGLEDAGMLDAFEHLEFPPRLPGPRRTGLRAGRAGHGVDAHAAVDGVDRDMLRGPVLEAVALGQQRAELVVADLAVLVGRADAGFLQGAVDCAGLLRVDRAGQRERGGGDAAGQRRDDAGVVRRAGAALLEGAEAGTAVEAAIQAGGRQEHRRLDERQPHLGLDDRRLTPQQAGQALGLAVGQDQRVVGGQDTAVGGPGPGVDIAGQRAGPALDLDHEQPGARQHQRVHLADLALVVDELEVGPDVPRVAVGQVGAQPVQRLALPREVRCGDDVPAGGAERHAGPRSVGWGRVGAPAGTCSSNSPTLQRNSLHRASIVDRSTRVAVSRYSAAMVLRFSPVRRATSEIRSLSRPMRVERWQRSIGGTVLACAVAGWCAG